MNIGDSPTLHLYLIRHGETERTLSRQYTGRTDIPMTAHGENESRELGAHLRDIPFTKVLMSPLLRARQTCELVGLKAAAQVDPDLAEWDYGDYNGLTFADICKVRPDWNLFRDGSPNGEMPAQVSDRADRVIARLRLLKGNVALFSHGHFGGVFAARWIGLPVLNAQHFSLDPTSLSILCFSHYYPDVPVITLWNATRELMGEASGTDNSEAKILKQRAVARWENEGGRIPLPASGASSEAGFKMP